MLEIWVLNENEEILSHNHMNNHIRGSLNSFSSKTRREISSSVLIQYLNNLRRIFRALSMTLHTLNKLFMCSFIEALLISLSRLHNHYYFSPFIV